ncbi:MAG TPA: cytochrome c biogenesis protein CcsA [Thermoanaerobaculia bacterium]|nr:cytochrome c biogenesis protein CcsA [Thermoanaerobaculia bacterium]
MQTILGAVNILLPVAYLLVAVDYGFLFFSAHPVAARTATPALRGTVLLHLGFLIGLAFRHNQFPAATVSQALSVVSLAVAAVYVFVEWRGRERSTGFWLVSLVFFFQLLSSLFAQPNPPDRDIFHNAVFATHVSLALLGYAAFVVGAGYAFLYLQLYRDLKAGRYSTFYGKLPPLAVLERMMLGALRSGFGALTGAVLTGGFWAYRSGYSLDDPKIFVTLAIWLIYGAALLLRRLRRWQGRQTALASLAGLCAILFSLVAVNFFFTGFHRFH